MKDVNDEIAQTQYLTFFLDGEEYAIGILQVKEVIEYDTVTRVPGTPPSIRGVINLRGTVVPVVDLAVKFGEREREISKRTCIVIVEVSLEGEATVMGLLVDAVSQVMELAVEDVGHPPAFGTGIRVEYLRAMGRVGKKFVLILDIDRLLNAEEVAEASAIASGREAVDSDGDGRSPAEGQAAAEGAAAP